MSRVPGLASLPSEIETYTHCSTRPSPPSQLSSVKFSSMGSSSVDVCVQAYSQPHSPVSGLLSTSHWLAGQPIAHGSPPPPPPSPPPPPPSPAPPPPSLAVPLLDEPGPEVLPLFVVITPLPVVVAGEPPAPPVPTVSPSAQPAASRETIPSVDDSEKVKEARRVRMVPIISPPLRGWQGFALAGTMTGRAGGLGAGRRTGKVCF